jgi:branched-chain amino acid transport system ATP-binding protein
VEIIFQVIQNINAQGTTVFLVEQNAHMALSIAAKGYVMEAGRIVLEGDAVSLMDNQDVRKAYLGD